MRGKDPLGQRTLPCRLFMQSISHALYSSSGIIMEGRSPVITDLGSWEMRKSQAPFKAWTKDLFDGLMGISAAITDSGTWLTL